jgi:transcriptional regulator with XRE-family HTH domain
MSLREVERRTGVRSGHLSQIETNTIGKPEMAILWELAALLRARLQPIGVARRLTGPDRRPRAGNGSG